MDVSTCGQLEVIQLPVGMLQSNCYLLFCTESRKAILIDPGDDGESILGVIQESNLQPVMILLTHGHGDHIGAIGCIQERYSIPIAIHKDEASMLTDASANLSALLGVTVLAPPADRLLEDQEQIDFEGQKLTVLHTPGHSRGGISILVGKHLFTGDTLFKDTVGRTDLPGASHIQLIQSIQNKILTLDDDIILYPGHGPTSTIGDERKYNPYLQSI